MASAQDIAQRWIENATGKNERVLRSRNYSNVYYAGDTIYSYGLHFAMGIVIRANREPVEGWTGSRATSYVRTSGEPVLLLLNGDSYSPSTTQHQGAVRAAAQSSNLETLIIPFTALEAADIDPASVEPIAIRPDRTEVTTHTQTETPAGSPVAAYRQDPETGEWGYSEPDPNRRHLHANGGPVAEWNEVSQNWVWETSQHFLGDSVIRARGRRDRTPRRYLSSFDYQEARPLYFLCELPRTGAAHSVEDAYELLKPPQVKAAEAQLREVSRQGDIFAIPTTFTTREVKEMTPYGKGRIVKRPRFGLLDTNHTASEVIFATGGRVYARGLLYHVPEGWRQPDHARRKMGDGRTWHLLTRNTVPRQRATPTREEAIA